MLLNFKKKIIISWVGISLICVFGADKSSGADKLAPQESAANGKVVAKINGKPILESQLTMLVQKDTKKFMKFGASMAGDSAGEHAKYKRALDKVVSNELLYQEAQKLEIKELEGKIDLQVERMNAQNKARFKGMSENKIREMAEREVLIKEYLTRNQLLKPEIPEKEIYSFYEKGKHNYIKPETADTRHILIKAGKESSESERKAAREKIDQARKAIVDGKSFEKVAEKYSECVSAKQGGSLGFIRKGYMPPEFDKVAFAIKPGELSEVIETKFGFHILKVLKREPGGLQSYEELKDFFKQYLQNQESKKRIEERVLALRQKADIQIYLK